MSVIEKNRVKDDLKKTNQSCAFNLSRKSFHFILLSILNALRSVPFVVLAVKQSFNVLAPVFLVSSSVIC